MVTDCNFRLGELEHLYQDRMAITRRSYKTQLADACKKIAGDYKKYYAQMLALETGHSGSVLQELKDTITRQTKVIKIQVFILFSFKVFEALAF